MPAHHIPHVKFCQFVVRQVCCLIALPQKSGPDLRSVFTAADADTDENIGALPVVKTVVEFRNYAPAERRAKLAERAGPFRNGYGE